MRHMSAHERTWASSYRNTQENARSFEERGKVHASTALATGLTLSRASSSIVAMDAVSDDSDDEDVEYKGHFCSGCSIPPPGGVRGWVRGYGGVGLWEEGPGCACCEDYD